MGFLATFVGRLFAPKGKNMLTKGAIAPAFDVLDQDGKRVKLSDFAGKRVVLWFYPKADTPG